MSESDWLTSSDPQVMLSFLRDRGPVSERKLRLLAAYCSRGIWHLLTDERSRVAVEVAERAIDGDVDETEREEVAQAAHVALVEAPSQAAWVAYAASGAAGTYFPDAVKPIILAFSVALRDPSRPDLLSNCPRQAAALSQTGDALRCIFGNPFRPVSVSPEWRTEAVVALGRGIYEERAYARMSVLGDALEDAGCDSREVLEHCRARMPHWKGCWCVDAVLGQG